MPARNDAAAITAAVRSVLEQDYAGPLELVIAIGPSHDGTEAVVNAITAGDARVRSVTNPPGGTAAGLNAAIAACTGEVIVRVDAHCELPDGYVTRAVETLERTGAANVGGVQRAVGSTSFQRAAAAAMTSRFGVGDAKFHYGGDEGPTDTVYLGVFRAEALRSVGGFDESLVRNQDYELNVRLRAMGQVVWFDPALEVVYHPRDSLAGLGRQYFDYGRWKREVIRRNPRAVRLRQLAAPVTVLGIAAGIAVAASGRRWGLLGPGVYGVAVLAASASVRDLDAADRRHLPAIFPTMHLGWGLGFLLGPPRRARGPARTPLDENRA